MENEEIVREEARDFYRSTVRRSGHSQPVDTFHEIRARLSDFYSSDHKALFLDEVELNIKRELQKHRDDHHGGKSSATCSSERDVEKLLFYIKQELDTLPKIAHQKFVESSQNIRDKVFVSYSHSDADFLKDVQRHFKPFLGAIDFWDDTKIKPGQKWKEEIRKAISKTKIAILLISTDFLGSEFIASDELPPLLEAAEKDGAVILILILKPCLFEEFPKLNQYQALNPPSQPISKMDENEKEEILVNMVRQTKRVMEGIEITSL